jgi:Protein of unknown function (DUF3224)
MTAHAAGTFEVKLAPQALSDVAAHPLLGRRSIDKTFHGDLEGTSKGEMMTAGTATPGSAAYVALEVVAGTLAGRSGTFVLQHMGTMNRGVPDLKLVVVPDSGTDALLGLTGQMQIVIDKGAHSYTFEYTLPPTL